MTSSRVAAGFYSALLTVTLSGPAVAAAATPVDRDATDDISAKQAASPTGAVSSWFGAIEASNGKAACAQMTKPFQRETIKSLARDGVGKPTNSCVEQLHLLGEYIDDVIGSLPAFRLKVVERSATKAVVRLTYRQKNSDSTDYTVVRSGSHWLISASTAD